MEKKRIKINGAGAVKNIAEMQFIYSRLIKWEFYREAELFIIGCNVALRISDLLALRFDDIHEIITGGRVDYVADIIEKKTKKPKRLTLNPAVMQAVGRLRERFPDHVYLFQATGNRAGKRIKPVSTTWVNKVFRNLQETLDLDFSFSTHSMRKTFGYHAYKNGADINVLQKLFNHSNVKETFLYIGITDEKVRDMFLDFSIDIAI